MENINKSISWPKHLKWYVNRVKESKIKQKISNKFWKFLQMKGKKLLIPFKYSIHKIQENDHNNFPVEILGWDSEGDQLGSP